MSKIFGKSYLRRLIAAEISTLTRYFDQLIQWQPVAPNDDGSLRSFIDTPKRATAKNIEELRKELAFDPARRWSRRSALLLNANLNHDFDVQGSLQTVASEMARGDRMVVVLYNPYWGWLYRLANFFKLRAGTFPTTFLTLKDLENLAQLAHLEVVRSRPVGYLPLRLLGLGALINRILPVVPLLKRFSLTRLLILRKTSPTLEEAKARPSLSVIIPARNERGNIEAAVTRMPNFDADLEIIFVEGHSRDQTWEEILRVQKVYGDRFKIRSFRQTGKGKNDAVRLGFAEASGELLTILDADLTMPPELLPRFYEAYVEGKADFVTGTRLIYPMEGEAMRFLNLWGNRFFASALSGVLGTSLSDALCGTKFLAKHDYERLIKWRGDFGDFDPFGDFELLFAAAILGLGIVNLPIRYRARTYGSTNISRFFHGWQLLRMTWIGFGRIQMGPRGV